jgi:glutamyl-tRNA reductase
MTGDKPNRCVSVKNGVQFVVVGLNHKTAPVEIREQAFIPESAVGECVQRLIDRQLIDSGALLSTCNRTELYALAPNGDAVERLVEAFGLWPHRLSFELWRQHAYSAAGDQAIRHLFRVAAGMESMVVGESQVLGQLKEALNLARGSHLTDARLEIVLRGALRAGKRVRSETALAREPVSVSHAAVVKAGEALGDLRGRGVLLLGAGPMSEIALRLLHNRRVGPVFVASRTWDRADQTARSSGAEAITMEALDDAADRVDIILSSSSAPHYLLDADRAEAFQSRRGHRPLLIVDMAVPRDVDPAVTTVAGVRLLDIDDLETIAERNREQRKSWIPAAEAIIDDELLNTIRALQAREAAPGISELVKRAERVRDSMLQQHLSRLPGADDRARAAMRDLAHALTARLLHDSIEDLRLGDEGTDS